MKGTAVVLLQLGGPDSVEAVEPFLFNLFMDPDIIDLPFEKVTRRPLARLIASRRSKHVAEHYRAIGNKSPILDLTLRQARALEVRLNGEGTSARTFVAMRYWPPLTEETLLSLKEDLPERILLLPMYPQFSKATTLSSLNEWRRQSARHGLDGIPTQHVCCYPGHPMFIEALVDNINAAYARFAGVAPADIDLLFSAHGLPESFIARGDPYRLQIEETVRRAVSRGGWRSPTHLCYQSKVGPSRWLGPSLVETVRSLATAGRKHLLVIPVAFVTDHIETLYEINIEARAHALEAGVRQFEMAPALNDHPTFIRCLAELVSSRIRAWDSPVPTCSTLWSATSSAAEPTLCPWRASTIERETHGSPQN